jgi:hypothetical protein
VRVPVVAAVLLTALLAGCSGAKDAETDATGSDDAPSHDDLAVAAGDPVVLTLNVTIGNQTYRFTGEDLASSRPGSSSSSGTVTVSSSNSTTSSGPAGNKTAPAGNATDTPSGPAPLNVTFELGARQLTYKSGLRWTLDAKTAAVPGAAGNATGNASAASTKTGMILPAKVDSTYNMTGTYRIAYTLRLANKTVDTLELNLIVSNGTATVQTPQDIPFSVEGTITVGTQGASCGVQGTVDLAEHAWDLTAVSSITTIVVHMDLGTTNVDSDIVLLDPAGAEIGGSADFNAAPPPAGSGSPTEDFTVEGPLDSGIYTFRVVGCTGVEMEYTITATASVLV